MVKKKSLMAAVFLLLSLSFSVFAQNQTSEVSNSENQTVETSVDETQFVFSDAATSSSDNSSEYKAPNYTGAVVRTIIALVVVIFLLYWILRIIKKKSNVVKSDDDFLRRAAYITVGNGNKTVEVITLIDRAYVIGVSDDKITLLDEITDEKERDKDLIQSMNLNADKKNKTKKPATFAEVLDMFTGKFNSTPSETKKKKSKWSLFNKSEETIDELLNKNSSEENSQEEEKTSEKSENQSE